METSPGDEAGSKVGFEVDKQICRCCLTTEKHMKSSVDVQQYFMELSGINVTLSDGMPQWVCIECSALMQKAIAFKYKMLRVHSVLYEYLMKCAPGPTDPTSPELTRYRTPHLSTTQTLHFDSLQENIGYHEVLQQEKQVLKSDLNQVPLLPMFEAPQTAFESVEAAFSDFEDDPLEYQYGNTEDEDLEEENTEKEEDEEDVEEEEDEDLEEEEEEDMEEGENSEEDDNSEENGNSEPEVKRIKSDKERAKSGTKTGKISDHISKLTSNLAWTSENTKTLIEFVRRNEALYNPKNELYKIAVLKQKLWRDIGTILNKSDSDCCRRWCYVRDYYIRRRGKAGGGEAAKKRAHLLSFLEHVPSAQRSWVPAESSHEEDQEEVKKESGSSERDPWEGIRIGEQFSKMSPNVWNGETDDVLIDFVKRNEVLYNPRNKNFRKVHLKQKLWREIATALHKTDSECYKRWCYVRDYYIRRKANPGALSTGKAAKRRADKLSFLDNDTAHRSAQSHNPPNEKQNLKSEREGQLSTESPCTALESVKAALSDFGPGQLRISERYSRKLSDVPWTGDDDDALIELVKRHEALYHPKSKDFRRTEMKQQLWIYIGNKLNRTDTDCCRRWCYVRDYYIRRRGKVGVLSTGKAAKRRADKLTFLDSVPSPRPGQSHEKQPLKSEQSDASQTAEDPTALESIQAKFSDLAQGPLNELRIGEKEPYSKMSSNVCWTSENDETLIDFVKRNEELYNPKSRKVELKQKLWSDLGSILDKSESDCYKRWCYVRDYYIRRRGKAGGGEAAMRRALLLSFLDNVPSPQRTSSSSAHKFRS